MALIPVKCLLPRILRERKLSPQDVFEPIGMTKQQFSDYYTTNKYMSLRTAATIASQLEIPIEDLYTWEVIEPRKRGRQKSE